ncbi:putative transcriptional regulator tpeD [Wolffia australiana]
MARVSLTVDAWTAENGTGLLGITIHWVDDTWTYRERVLAIREIVVYAVTTDNATTNTRMLAFDGKKVEERNQTFTARRHIPCVAHILNIVVQTALKSFGIPSAQGVEPEEGDVARTADQYDSDHDDDLGDACEDDPEVSNSNMVVLDCPTRWNNMYTMLAATVKKRDVLDQVSMAFGWKATSFKLSKDEWELVKEF